MYVECQFEFTEGTAIPQLTPSDLMRHEHIGVCHCHPCACHLFGDKNAQLFLEYVSLLFPYHI